jgi:signal transduction histidine kinase/DNA-binding response OmpR family regulator/ligand-binding sensor domain-containing protein
VKCGILKCKKAKMHYRKLFIIGFFFLQTLICFSASTERFLHFTEIDGLPRNITNCIAQDQYGYIWIGTNNGVARFDGKDFNHYEELSDAGIIQLLYDSENTLWAGTNRGLYKYNPITNFFDLVTEGYIAKMTEDKGTIYFLMMSDIFKIENNEPVLVFQGNDISDFCFSEEGLWVSKSDDGLSLFDRNNNFETVKASFLKNLSVAQIKIIDSLLLVGMYNGELYTITENRHLKEVKVNNHYFYKTFKTIGDEIWAATDGNGIIVFDKNLKFLRKLDRNSNNSISINSNSIYDILLGRNKEIWIATYGAGLTCILPDNQLFRNILPEKGNNNSLVANEGVSVFVNEPKIYFGTNYGLSEWNISTQQFKNLPSNQLQKELNGTKVTALSVDTDKAVWVGTYDGLLGKYSSDLTLIKSYHPCSKHPNEMQQIVGIKEVSQNNLVLLTQFHSQVLLNFNKTTETSSVFELYFKGSNVTYCLLNSLRSNQQGELLAVISNLGLYHVNWKENVIENRLQGLNTQLQSTTISDFYHDQEGNYWISSSTDGLFCISADGSLIKKWTEKDGLPSNVLVRIESTDDRYLWISTISGICRFDTESDEILNFNHRDGLPANEFQDRVSAKLNDGRVVFGSLAGFTLIDPSKVNTDTIPTEVVISDITFQNQSIRSPHGAQYLTKALEETEKIVLPYNMNSFTIHFFTKNKSFSKYNNYEYRLVGLEENWNYQGETNFTSYTNLSPGTYTFEIKSADKSQPGHTTSLNVNIMAPWYLSLYAYVFYIILFFIILYLSIYAFLKRFELLKQEEISAYKLQKEHELTEKKLEFFTNISHDLKTPLTLISAPVKDLLQSEDLNHEQLNKLSIVDRNSKRLYKLITDLLDFRKITNNQFNLEVKETDISALIKNSYEAFIEDCRSKSVKLVYSASESLTAYVDTEKIEKIVWNLLSNALKFTPNGGEIVISLKEFNENHIRKIELKISDNGIGVSEADKNKIFERFYKGKKTGEINHEGTGIGLSIVKELIVMHHGQIHVDSIPDQGSTFCVTIPIDKKAYHENEIAICERPTETMHSNTYDEAGHLKNNTQRILVVEDNDELRDYLAANFLKKYTVTTAADGFEGLKIVRKKDIDIIITDVQMPKMNGYDFCKELRADFDTSHIPIVMLTANNTIEQQLEGLSTGADIYLTKPFDIRILDAHIVSLLERRDKLRKKFSGIGASENLHKTLPQKDVDFILELKQLIEKNMMNHELNVEFLSVHFSVSLAQFHRKVKSLSGTTPNNLIKSVRLKKAYQLIREEGCRVSEAAYQTGFSDPNYFTTCFRKEFGETPSQVAVKIF